MKKVFSLIAVVALFASCATDKLEEGNITPLHQVTDSNVIPLDDALDGMFDLMNDLYGPGTRAAGRSIASIDNFNGAGGKTRSDGSPETLAYVVNFEEGGFAVLSATTDHEPVVCITEGGSLSLEDLEEARNKRLNPEPVTTEGPMWMSYEDIHNYGYGEEGNPEPFVYEDYAVDWEEGDTVTEDLGEYPVSSADPTELISGMVATYYDRYNDPNNDDRVREGDDPDSGDYNPLDLDDQPDYAQPSPSIPTYEYGDWTDADDKIGPLLTTKWHQSAPFNNECPVMIFKCEKAPAGCVPIALAQIIAFNEQPATSFFGVSSTWDELKNYTLDKETKTASDLSIEDDLATIARTIGIFCLAQYNFLFSGGTFAWPVNAESCMKDFGYSDTKRYEGYKADKIEEMLNAGKPVFIAAVSGLANGHAWVIDGSVNQTQEVKVYRDGEYCETFENDRYLIHCNFGWGGFCDGYYFHDVFDLNNGPVAKDGTDDRYKDETRNRDYDCWFRIITY